MHETTTLILMIFGAILTWTVSVASLVLWLTSKFRELEKTIYREMDKHRREDDEHFDDHAIRIQRLEITNYGVTSAP